MVFFDQRISDLKSLGCQKVAVETCSEEYLEVSPFKHGVSLNSISFGPRYRVIVDDFERAKISRFLKVVEKEDGNFVKVAGEYACFYQKMKNDEVARNGLQALDFLKSAAKVVPPFTRKTAAVLFLVMTDR